MGGASVNNLLMQIQADFADVKIIRPKIIETTAQGAAFLAGLAVGFWKDLDEIKAIWKSDSTFDPQANTSILTTKKNWNKAISRSKNLHQ